MAQEDRYLLLAEKEEGKLRHGRAKVFQSRWYPSRMSFENRDSQGGTAGPVPDHCNPRLADCLPRQVILHRRPLGLLMPLLPGTSGRTHPASPSPSELRPRCTPPNVLPLTLRRSDRVGVCLSKPASRAGIRLRSRHALLEPRPILLSRLLAVFRGLRSPRD